MPAFPYAADASYSEERWTALFAAAVLALTAFRLVWLWVQPADLYPDEAQYWFWSRHLAVGYYSKPPLVPWLIALTTALFGNSEFAVRLSAPLLHAIAALFVYGVASRLYDRRIGFCSGFGYLSLPGVSVSSYVISTDAALMPCWAAALYGLVRARDESRARWWVLIGVATGLGLLAKYAMGYWSLAALAFLVGFRSERIHLKRLAASQALGFLIYFPNLWWNWQHRFASYVHLGENADLGGALFHPTQFLLFLASQFAVFGPLFFAFLVWLLVRAWRLHEPRERLLAAFAIVPLATILVISCLSRAHANWAATAYVSATVLVVAAAIRRGWRSFSPFCAALHLIAVYLLFAAPAALSAFGHPLAARYDPLHRLRGWKRLGEQVGAVLAAHPGYRILADDRETLAALSYYVHPHPFDEVDWDPLRVVGNGWDLTPGLSIDRGKNFVVVSAHHTAGQMKPVFAKIKPLGPLVIGIGPGMNRRYSLYLARDFLGYRPGPGVRGTPAPGAG